MIIWLQGPSGAGKTTLGRDLAASLGRPFVDLDEMIAEGHGSTVADIFWNEGESNFRRLEWDALLDLTEHGARDAVVALGGGAVADHVVRRLIRSCGVRVFVDVEPDEAMRRLESGEPRPLLFEEDPAAVWRRLYRQRLRHYQDADIIITSDGSPGEVAADLARRVDELLRPSWSITTQLFGRQSNVLMFHSLYVLKEHLRASTEGRPVCIVTDRSIAQAYEDFLFTQDEHDDRIILMLEPGEGSKSLTTVEEFARELSVRGFTRDGIIIGIGGGVVTDVAGFLASVYMRGVDVCYVPTTLLAQVDAAIGGKTAVNAGGVRNLIGTFNAPSEILICPMFIRTLSYRELKSGFVESVKMGIANSEVLADEVGRAMPSLLSGEIPTNIEVVIQWSIETKLDVVARDAFDTSLRHSLNFGHTFGHALEAVAPGEYAHGEAVAFGMIAAAEIAFSLGSISANRKDAVIALSIPFTYRSEVRHSVDRIINAMRSDKKRSGKELTFVLPTDSTGVQIIQSDDSALIASAIRTAFTIIETYHQGQ